MEPCHRGQGSLPPHLDATGLFWAWKENWLCSGAGSRSKKKAIIPPQQGAVLINPSGCKAHLEAWQDLLA